MIALEFGIHYIPYNSEEIKALKTPKDGLGGIELERAT